MTVPAEEAPANYVPAAAVIRRERALSGFIGRKARVGGLLSQVSNPEAQPLSSVKIMTVTEEEAPANYVPAAAVIRRERALSGFTGCKGCVGGLASQA